MLPFLPSLIIHQPTHPHTHIDTHTHKHTRQHTQIKRSWTATRPACLRTASAWAEEATTPAACQSLLHPSRSLGSQMTSRSPKSLRSHHRWRSELSADRSSRDFLGRYLDDELSERARDSERERALLDTIPLRDFCEQEFDFMAFLCN